MKKTRSPPNKKMAMLLRTAIDRFSPNLRSTELHIAM